MPVSGKVLLKFLISGEKDVDLFKGQGENESQSLCLAEKIEGTNSTRLNANMRQRELTVTSNLTSRLWSLFSTATLRRPGSGIEGHRRWVTSITRG